MTSCRLKHSIGNIHNNLSFQDDVPRECSKSPCYKSLVTECVESSVSFPISVVVGKDVSGDYGFPLNSTVGWLHNTHDVNCTARRSCLFFKKVEELVNGIVDDVNQARQNDKEYFQKWMYDCPGNPVKTEQDFDQLLNTHRHRISVPTRFKKKPYEQAVQLLEIPVPVKKKGTQTMSEQSRQVHQALKNLGEDLSFDASWGEFRNIQSNDDFSSLAQGFATTQKVAQVYRALPKPIPPMDPGERLMREIHGKYIPGLVIAPDSDINAQLQRLRGLPAYFHGTHSLKNIISMLNDGQIEMRCDKGIPGAFVSTKPEPRYGPYYFAFSRNIEFERELVSCRSSGSDYWPGFNGIQAHENNVLYIIVDTEQDIGPGGVERVRQDIFDGTGRKIEVISLKEMKQRWERQTGTEIDQTQSVIPRHWPDAGQIIFHEDNESTTCRKVRNIHANCNCVVNYDSG